MYGFSDPTEDLALAYFVYWGRHLPGISQEIAKRVLELALLYDIRLHDLHVCRFYLFHFSRALLGCSFELITKLVLTPEGYWYLFVRIDCFSNWTVIHPLCTKSSDKISDWFYR